MKYPVGTLLVGYDYTPNNTKKPIPGIITRVEMTEVGTPLYYIEWSEGESDNDWFEEEYVRDFLRVLKKEAKRNVKVQGWNSPCSV